MSEPIKRIILTRYWVGDTVYARADGSKGFVTQVELSGEQCYVRYFCVFDDRKGEWCHEMELTAEKTFNQTGSEPTKA